MKVQENDSKTVQFWYKLFQLIGAQWMARAVAVVSIIFVSALIFAQVAPAAGEAWVYNITLFSGILTACLLAIVCLMVVSVGVNLTTVIIGAGIKQAREMNAPQHALLPASTETDIIVVEQVDEPDFAGRMAYELSNLASGKYAAVIRFRNPQILITANGKDTLMPRDSIKEGSSDKAANETIDDYDAFVTEAIGFINNDFQTIRAKTSDNLREVFASTVARVAGIALLIALPFAAFTQSKTERVQQGVPQIAANVYAKGIGIQYNFASGEITRTSDGSASVAQLVAQNRPGADADNMGALKGVTIGTTHFEAKQVEKPKPLFTDVAAPHNMAIPVNMPDSTQVVAGIEQAKESFYFYKSKAWSFIRPAVDFIYWLLWVLIPLIVGFLTILNVGSRSARANENLGPKVRNMGVKMAALAWMTNFILSFLVLSLITISVFFWEIHPIWACIVIVIVGLVAYFTTNRATPNGEHQRSVTTRYDSRALPPGK